MDRQGRHEVRGRGNDARRRAEYGTDQPADLPDHDERCARRSDRAFAGQPDLTCAAARCSACRSRCSSPVSRRRRSPMTAGNRSEEHTSELQSLMRISYAVFCLKKKKKNTNKIKTLRNTT